MAEPSCGVLVSSEASCDRKMRSVQDDNARVAVAEVGDRVGDGIVWPEEAPAGT